MISPASSVTHPAQPRFRHIDALRGIAVLLVVMVHVGHYTDGHLWFTEISRFGQYGVQLFFTLSAFTLCHSISRLDRLGPEDYSAFLTKRFFRIAPMYYGAAIFYTLYTVVSHQWFGKTPWTEPGDFSPGAFLSNATFTHAFWPTWINSVVPGGWSIACEFLFYLIFPFLFFACRRHPTLFILLLSAAAVITFLLPAIYGNLGCNEIPANNSFFYYFPTTQMPAFIAGMLLYRWRESGWFHLISRLLAVPALILLVWCHAQTWGWMAAPAISAVFFIGLISCCSGMRVPAWLERTGECSFSVYLVHFFIVWNVCVPILRNAPALLEHNATAALLYFAICALSILISRQTYLRIELPMISYGQRMTLRLRRTFSRDHVAPAN